jgi:flagellar hook-associated protein 3 FlgL
MINRLSTAGTHSAAIREIMKQQSLLSKTQTQVGSGSRIQSPADDPIATVRILAMEQNRANLEQYGKNSDLLASRLSIGEQALADASTLLQNVRERALQANGGVLADSDRRAIALDIRSRAQELLDIANRRDGNGDYLFSGFSTQTQPFSRTGTGVSYAGDQGVRTLQIGTDQRIADGFSGADVFQRITEGNGTFTTATGTHAGTGSIDSGRVTNPAAWVAGSYTLNFTTASTWEVRDAGAALVASGNYTSGSSIAFNGAEVVVTGAPAAGDSFSMAPAAKMDVFAALDALATSLEAPGTTAADRALISSGIAAGLTQVDQALNHILDTRAVVGARLNAVDTATASRQQLDDQLADTVGGLRDLDYAAAISRMNQQLTGLQAAQAAYSKIAQLSLFNYL